jgi:nitroimidazol reductase NimA-like FMN-containing flavoprotein (pyridoxamine 5'-phosphate oxidase superfamily)
MTKLRATRVDAHIIVRAVAIVPWKRTRRRSMDDAIRQKVQSLQDRHRTMRIATLRPDGWPQVTTVGYAYEGFTIYFLCGLTARRLRTSRGTTGCRLRSMMIPPR